MKDKFLFFLKYDFEKVNEILVEIVDELQDRLGWVLFFFFLVDWLGNDKDEVIINFSMGNVWVFFWELACEFWCLKGLVYEQWIEQVDYWVYQFGGFVVCLLGWVLRNGFRLM